MAKKRIYKYVYDQKMELGRGAFGVVYCGIVDWQNQKKQKVAIKVLNKKKIDKEPYLKQAFISEIKTLRKIVSSNIVGFKEVIQTDNHYYIVQEYCDGGDLYGLLNKQGTFPQVKAIEYMIQILTGFFDIMRCGIVHRDFKPQNVLINKGKLKIADFGLARSTGDVLSSSVGTPLYQSPQILKGQVYSSKCDIWAIGLVFYQMLYGKLPWQQFKSNKKTYLEGIMKKKLQFPKQPQVRDQVKKFIQNCLIRQQSGRMDWPQLFRNEIFQDKLPNYQILDQIFCYAVKQIVNTIQDQCLDLKRVFNKYNSNKSKNMDQPMTRKDLHIMIKKLAPYVKSYHIDFVLSKFDKNSDGLIDFEQFRKTLKSGQQIRAVLTSQQIKTVIFRWAQHAKQEYVQKCKAVWNKLHQKIISRPKILGPHQLLIQNFKDRNGRVDFNQQQFTYLLKKLDPELTPNQCYILFRLFDNDGNDIISGQQYYRNMNKLTTATKK